MLCVLGLTSDEMTAAFLCRMLMRRTNMRLNPNQVNMHSTPLCPPRFVPDEDKFMTILYAPSVCTPHPCFIMLCSQFQKQYAMLFQFVSSSVVNIKSLRCSPSYSLLLLSLHLCLLPHNLRFLVLVLKLIHLTHPIITQ